MSRVKVGIIYGGKSAEHEVSLLSAENVIAAIDTDKYEPIRVFVDKEGKLGSGGSIAEIANLSLAVAFPLIHGPFGEDGTLQGMLKLLDVPFVGSGVLGSAVGMDKDIMKRLLRDAGVPIGRFIAVKKNYIPSFEEATTILGLPLFVKPANMGSSVGVSKVVDGQTFEAAVEEAFRHDTKVLLEEFIAGREIECAILGIDEPQASICGEVIPSHEFYSYEAKYLDEKGAALAIPANITAETQKELQALAIKTFLTLECSGFSRVDFFLKANGEVLVNEINTIPGFTSSSMYPKLWEESGIGYPELIDRLIQLAIKS